MILRACIATFLLTTHPLLAAQAPGVAPETDLAAVSLTLRQLAARASPAVVQIYATAYAPVESGLLPSATGLARQQTSGSGVILDSRGFLVTNAHVVERARRIQVQLAAPVQTGAPGRSIVRPRGPRLDARLVGVDRETDLAILRIDGEEDLPYLDLGDSDRLSTGDLVLALGSPLGLSNSVTLGIVSATARQLLPEDSMIYIQTDATINPGNSGGALLDMEGHLVGINTLILSRSGGSEGIGFAAPSNIVRHVYEQIRRFSRVRRGDLGVRAQTVTPELAAGLGLPRDWGVVVADVEPRGPASAAGLQAGDLVSALDGKIMENARQFEVNVYQREPGTSVRLAVVRGAAQQTLSVPVRLRETRDEQFLHLAVPEEHLLPQLGILAVDVDARLARMLPPARKLGGVVVAARTIETLGPDAGFLPGDVIHQLNGREILGSADLREALDALRPGQAVVVQVQRGEGLLYLSFRLD